MPRGRAGVGWRGLGQHGGVNELRSGNGKERDAAGGQCHGLVRWSECHTELSGHLRRHVIAAPARADGSRPRYPRSVTAQPHAGRSIPQRSPRGGHRGRAGCERVAAREHVAAGRNVVRCYSWSERTYSELGGLAGGGMRPELPPMPATGSRASRPALTAQPLLVLRMDATVGTTRAVPVASSPDDWIR